MSTRSRIALEEEEGQVISIYCHSDGWPEGVGRALLGAFPEGTNPAVIREYIMEGDRSAVNLSYKELQGYGRQPLLHQSLEDFFTGDIEEYGYLYTRGGQWLVKSAYNGEAPAYPTSLVDVLSGVLEERMINPDYYFDPTSESN